MSKGLSYTQRTLRYLRENGVVCEVVEKWIIIPNHPGGGKRKDLFGFIDILCLWPGEGIVGVQSTSGAQHTKHIKKIYGECREMLTEWLKYGAKVKLISWKKKKLERGGKAMRWFPRVEDIDPARRG